MQADEGQVKFEGLPECVADEETDREKTQNPSDCVGRHISFSQEDLWLLWEARPS